MRIDLQLLGSLDATVSGRSFVPTAAKQRQLLAVLALNAGRSISTPVLVEELWDLLPPRSATSTLHTYIGKLRNTLERALGDRDLLATEGNSYRLNVPRDWVDCWRYEDLAAAGRLAADAGDFPAAARHLATALAQWHGAALADVQRGPHLTIEAVRLEQCRLGDLELRIEADLRLGRHRALLGELAGLCAQYSMSESLCAQYMLALHRAGHQWRALEVYQRLRATMVEQLGLEPAAAARHLQRAILSGDPGIDDPGFVPGQRVAVAVASGQLPIDPRAVAVNPIRLRTWSSR